MQTTSICKCIDTLEQFHHNAEGRCTHRILAVVPNDVGAAWQAGGVRHQGGVVLEAQPRCSGYVRRPGTQDTLMSLHVATSQG